MVRRLSRAGAVIVVTAVTALVVTGLGLGASSATSKLSAKLDNRQEVPAVAAKAGVGLFTGTLSQSYGSTTITWRLTFSHLSGAAGAAHIHLGKPGKAGGIIVPLCAPCKSGAHGTAKVTAKVVKAIQSGSAYVNVHTAKNPDGEIRGQIKSG